MITRLLRRQLRHGRKHTIRITSQHNNITRLPFNHTRYSLPLNKLNRIRTPRILRNTRIVVVWFSANWIVDDVFEDGSESNGCVDFGLFLSGEVDAFSVAATLDVEDTRVRPDVLVVANEQTPGVRGEGRLASAGETEEKGDIALVYADVGGGVE